MNAIAPATIERASMAAYSRPFVPAANASVANATDGAAPNNPANRFGSSMSPSNANKDTNKPPASILKTICKNIAMPSRQLFRRALMPSAMHFRAAPGPFNPKIRYRLPLKA